MFGPFHLDAQGETLYRGTEPVALIQRGAALLRALIDRAGAPVSKDALMKAAWPGLAVEDSNLTVQIDALRRARRGAGGESWIATLPRRVYRFVGPAVTKSEALVPATSTVDVTRKPAPMMALAFPDKPSIAVLPFENLSGDPEQGFADGMVEDEWARSAAMLTSGQPLLAQGRSRSAPQRFRPICEVLLPG